MAKAFRALKRVTHNGDTYEIGDSIAGLKVAEAKRLQELGAIEGAVSEAKLTDAGAADAQATEGSNGSDGMGVADELAAKLAEMNVPELRAMATELGLDCSKDMKRAELVAAIIESQEDESDAGDGGQPSEPLPGVNPQLGGD